MIGCIDRRCGVNDKAHLFNRGSLLSVGLCLVCYHFTYSLYHSMTVRIYMSRNVLHP